MIGGEDERENLLGGNSRRQGAGGDDEDFFLTGPKVSFSGLKLSGIRDQVEEVTNVMRDNIGAVLERGQNLTELNTRSERLGEASTNFRTQAERVRRRAWWENMKTRIIIGVVILVVVIIIIIIAAS